MEIKKLKGGKVIGVNPDRLQVPLYADEPKIRVGTPGTIQGNVGLYVQLNECSRRQHGKPEPTLVKVVFREVGKELLLAMAPALAEGPDVYQIKFEKAAKAPVVRFLKPLFEEAEITLRSDLWYEMDTAVAEDEELGFVVVGNWTAATTRARSEAERDVAASEQLE